MGIGFQCFNADGSLQFDASTSLMRTIGEIDTGTSGGSATIAGIATGTLAVGILPGSTDNNPPTVSVSGNTVTWSPAATKPDNARLRLMVMA